MKQWGYDMDKIKKMLAKQLGIKEDKIKPESRIVEDLGADSLDVVELLMTLEDEFNISVTDEEAATLKTVEDILNILKENKKIK